MREGTIGVIESPLQADLGSITNDIRASLDADLVLLSLKPVSRFATLGLTERITSARGGSALAPSALVTIHENQADMPVLLPDMRAHPEYRKLPIVTGGTVSGYIGVPIRNSELGTIGTISAYTSTLESWRMPDLQYLKTIATSVENLILREMYRMESIDASSLASEYDNIIAAFSLVRADPTSIHDRAGRLVFANKALTEIVPEPDLESAHVGRALGRPLSDDPLKIEFPNKGLSLNVRRSETSSGYFVCQWDPVRDQLH